jgi:hypothetical protein
MTDAECNKVIRTVSWCADEVFDAHGRALEARARARAADGAGSALRAAQAAGGAALMADNFAAAAASHAAQLPEDRAEWRRVAAFVVEQARATARAALTAQMDALEAARGKPKREPLAVVGGAL